MNNTNINLKTLAKLVKKLSNPRKPLESYLTFSEEGVRAFCGNVAIELDGNFINATLEAKSFLTGDTPTIVGDTIHVGMQSLRPLVGEVVVKHQRLSDPSTIGNIDSTHLKGVSSASANKDGILDGVHLAHDYMAATDGKFLIHRKVDLVVPDQGVILPPNGVDTLVAIGGIWTLKHQDGICEATSGPWCVRFKLMEGTYPNTSGVFVPPARPPMDLTAHMELVRKAPKTKGESHVVFAGCGVGSLNPTDGWQCRFYLPYNWQEGFALCMDRRYVTHADKLGVNWSSVEVGRGYIMRGKGYEILIMPVTLSDVASITSRIASALVQS